MSFGRVQGVFYFYYFEFPSQAAKMENSVCPSPAVERCYTARRRPCT